MAACNRLANVLSCSVIQLFVRLISYVVEKLRYFFSADFQEVFLVILPFFHIFGFNGLVLPQLARGSKLITIPKFLPELFIDVLTKHTVSLPLRCIIFLHLIFSRLRSRNISRMSFSFSFCLVGDGPLHSPADTFVLQR